MPTVKGQIVFYRLSSPSRDAAGNVGAQAVSVQPAIVMVVKDNAADLTVFTPNGPSVVQDVHEGTRAGQYATSES